MALAAWFAILVAVISGFKIGLGLIAGFWALASGIARMPVVAFIYLALILTFTTGAIFLLNGRRRDPRALYLGVCFLLVATSFSDGATSILLGVPVLGFFVDPLRCILPESFLPFFAWCFFTDFPRVRALGPDRVSARGRAASLVLGAFLLSSNVLLGLPEIATSIPWLSVFDRGNTVGAYWFLLFGFAVPAFVYALLRVRKANREENRRTNLLVFGFVVGSLPVTLLVLASILSPGFHRYLTTPPWFALSQIAVYAGLLSIPITTVYAVLARGALDIRLVIRAAIRYVLARRTVTALTLLPIAVLLVVLFMGRDQTLGALVSGPSGWALLVAGSIGLLGLRFRGTALRALDQRFFREQYDARTILRALVHGVREVGNLEQLSGLLSREIDRALHPRFAFVLTLDPLSRYFETRGKEVAPLPETSMIAGALRGEPSPLDLRVFRERSGQKLSSLERHWLEDSDAHLIVPLLGRRSELLGMILLGEKRSELPYSSEDRGLLLDIAAAATDTLAQRLLPQLRESLGEESPSTRRPSPEGELVDRGAAQECVDCGRVGPSRLAECPVCGGKMTEAPVPAALRGVYRMETRIGMGGMGLVYRAFDTTLGRPVAVKTLVRVDPELAARLRHEARAMASVAHPNLATIYGAETWKGRPLILVEYFGAGTLEDRLAKGPLSSSEAIHLGIALARGVEHLHDLGMLHRDIKPSNIGLSGKGEPKLLDFGLVQFLSPERNPPSASVERLDGFGDRLPGPDQSGVSLQATRTGRFRGTMPYLSPEVLAGESPGVESDLWSLAVVLFEAIAGVNPFTKAGAAARTVAPDIRTIQRDCPPEVSAFFTRALSPDPSMRPRTVRGLREELEGVAFPARSSVGRSNKGEG